MFKGSVWELGIESKNAYSINLIFGDIVKIIAHVAFPFRNPLYIEKPT